MSELTFAKQIKLWRGKLSLKEAAAILEIDYPSFRKYACGKRTPSKLAAETIAARMDKHERESLKMFSVYSITDPREPEILRYVGATRKPLGERLSEHVYIARKTPTNPFRKWIKSLCDSGIRPKINLLQACSGSEIVEAESRFIEMAIKNPLCLNCTNRGAKKYTQETDEKWFVTMTSRIGWEAARV